jgi:hypothetical protein
VKRIALVAAAIAAVAAAALAVALLRGRDSNPVVAKVGSTEIRQDDLDLTVEHFHEEADREGRRFPDKGTKAYTETERAALRLLIDRAAIEAGAARLGVHVSDAAVEDRLAAQPGGESDESGDIRVKAEAAFRRGTVRDQLVTERVFRKLTAGLAVSPAAVRAYYVSHRRAYGSMSFSRTAPLIRNQLLAARKNAVYGRWLAKIRRSEPEAKL